jgi:hypothetical protein
MEGGDVGPGLLELFEDAFGVGDQDLGLRGEADPPAHGLQRRDAGLGHAGLGHGGERAVVGELAKEA